MARIRGSYPGGPRREGGPTGDEPAPAHRLERVEDRETRLGHFSQARQRRRRVRRVWSGFVVAVALAGGLGLYMGFKAHRSSAELTTERQQTSREQLKADMSRETNRVLMELWKMEDVEKQVTPP